MPVNLPPTWPADPRLLSLLARIAGNDGKICISEDEYGNLEQNLFFTKAQDMSLLHVDYGSEWTCGVVISITRDGLNLIGHAPAPGLWERIELLVRGRFGGARGRA